MKLHESLTTDRIVQGAQESCFGLENIGFCIACGEEADGCEPDARRYPCACCGENKVYGAEELLVSCC